MKILCAGAAGFIGSNFVNYWNKKYPGTLPIVVDSLTYAGNPDNLEGLCQYDYLFYQYDINETDKLIEIIKEHKVDLVVSFAAHTHVDNSLQDVTPFIHSNVSGVVSVIQACLKTGIPLYHMSTDEVMAHKPPQWAYENNGLTGEPGSPFWHFTRQTEESAVFSPGNPYAASKASGEMLVQAYKKSFGLPATILRPSNIYGPKQLPEKLLPKAITNILQGKKVPVYGKGNQWRTWTYISDFCEALDLIIHKGTQDVYHISSEFEQRNIDTIKKLLDIMGQSHDMIDFIDERKGHDWNYSLSSSRLRKELRWKPKTDFEIGLKETISYYEKRMAVL